MVIIPAAALRLAFLHQPAAAAANLAIKGLHQVVSAAEKAAELIALTEKMFRINDPAGDIELFAEAAKLPVKPIFIGQEVLEASKAFSLDQAFNCSTQILGIGRVIESSGK